MCVRACVRACVHACVRACMRVSVCVCFRFISWQRNNDPIYFHKILEIRHLRYSYCDTHFWLIFSCSWKMRFNAGILFCIKGWLSVCHMNMCPFSVSHNIYIFTYNTTCERAHACAHTNTHTHTCTKKMDIILFVTQQKGKNTHTHTHTHKETIPKNEQTQTGMCWLLNIVDVLKIIIMTPWVYAVFYTKRSAGH